jgi:HSP20 family protein
MFSLIPWKKRNGNVRVRTGGVARPWEREEDLLLRLRDDLQALMNRFFDDRWLNERFFGVPSLWEEPRLGWHWDFGWEDRDNEYVFRAEVPGFEPEDFDIQVSGNVVTVKAEHKTESGKKGGDYTYRYGSFKRTMTLPHGADANQITARYHSGVLEVHVPKSAEARGKRIEVKVG